MPKKLVLRACLNEGFVCEDVIGNTKGTDNLHIAYSASSKETCVLPITTSFWHRLPQNRKIWLAFWQLTKETFIFCGTFAVGADSISGALSTSITSVIGTWQNQVCTHGSCTQLEMEEISATSHFTPLQSLVFSDISWNFSLIFNSD